MILIILILILIFSYINNRSNLFVLLLFMIGFSVNRCVFPNKLTLSNLIEGFSTDNLRFIPCSDNIDNHMYHNYQLEPIKNINKQNNILDTLYSDNIDNMFKMSDCSMDSDYKFNKSYTGFFDRKIYSIDSIQQKLNDDHNVLKDNLLYNEPYIYRHPEDLETKLIFDYDNKFKKDFEKYLDHNEDIHYSFNRGLEYKTCGNIDNNGRKYHCPYPYIFNYENSEVLCTENNEYCRNVCCSSP